MGEISPMPDVSQTTSKVVRYVSLSITPASFLLAESFSFCYNYAVDIFVR
jgi:hypothetical protein